MLAIALGAPCLVQAQQGFPERPIRIVVPATAGGTQDTLARLIAPKLSERFGQSVVIDNRKLWPFGELNELSGQVFEFFDPLRKTS